MLEDLLKVEKHDKDILKSSKIMGILDKLAHQFRRLDSLTFRFQHDWFSDEGR